MTKTMATATMTALVAGMMACGGATANGDRAMTPSAPSERAVFVTVRNDNWLDVNVYRVHSGAQFRLGTVSALSVGMFRVTDVLTSGGGLSLRIDPIGSNNAYTTEPIFVAPNQHVQLNVAERLSMSTFSVLNRAPRR